MPKSLKRKMEKANVNQSGLVKDAIGQRLRQNGGRHVAQAVLINERLRRKAPKGWNSTRVIRYWRSKRP